MALCLHRLQFHHILVNFFPEALRICISAWTHTCFSMSVLPVISNTRYSSMRTNLNNLRHNFCKCTEKEMNKDKREIDIVWISHITLSMSCKDDTSYWSQGYLENSLSQTLINILIADDRY